MNNENNFDSKLRSYIGLAQRAGGVLYGEDIITEKARAVKLALIDSDASEKYKNRIKLKFAEKACFEVKDLFGAVHRENVKAIGVTNGSLAEAIINLLRCIDG